VQREDSLSLSPDIVQALVKVIELKDLSTAAHTWRVVLYTRIVAEELGLSHDEVDRMGVAAALHDLGKIDIPEHILQKPAKLTDEEFRIIMTHPSLGHERLVAMGADDPLLLELVRHHHERVDGKGYPDKLVGSQIPRAGKIFSVIDSFDALTSHRPYRHDVGERAGNRAIIELQAGLGTRYDPLAVEVFAELFHSGKLGWIMQHFNDGRPVPEQMHLSDLPGVTKDLRLS
jgi:HD-GYP domain-containing protein (c-di-GMP phosphodiesterase class II)